MALQPTTLISNFTSSFRKFNPESSIIVPEIIQGIQLYLSTGLNIIPGPFTGWIPPTAQLLGVFRNVFNFESSVFASNLTTAIESGLATIQTAGQIGPVVFPKGLMLPDILKICRVPNPSSDIFAIGLATTIDKTCRAIQITVSDPKAAGATIIGPFT